MKYAFFSRRSGYEGGQKVRVYMSKIINDPENISFEYVDKNGEEILHCLKSISSDAFIVELTSLAEINKNWYYYSIYKIITDTRIYI